MVSSNGASEQGKKDDLSDFKCGMAVSARQTGMSISEMII